MKITKCLKREDYEIVLPRKSPGDFLQSWNWGEVQEKAGFKVERYLIEGHGVFTVIVKPLFAGLSYWYIPRGPLLVNNWSDDEKKFFISWLKKSPAVFVRLEPSFIWPQGVKVLSAKAVQPLKTWVLDLKKSSDTLLSEMGQKTRYNIRLAEKKGLELVSGEKYLPDFWRLMQETSARDSFKEHSQNYYKNLLSDKNIFLLAVSYKQEIVAAGIFAKFGEVFYYLHGASNYSKRQLMAPYFLQWQAISMAKGDKCLLYDFYGIDEKKWPGVTRFKLGFGGQELVYAPIGDIVAKPGAYRVYGLLKFIKRFI